MFGGKLKTWMETHIGRQRKTKGGQNQSGQPQSGQPQSGQNQSGQPQSGQNQSGQNQSGQNQSGQNVSGGGSGGSGGSGGVGSERLHSCDSLATHSDTGVSSSSLQVGGCRDSTATIGTIGSARVTEAAHAHMSSPESAYSTGYSTDGDALQPEYYINIRSSRHYFPSPAPTPTSPLTALPSWPSPLTALPSWPPPCDKAAKKPPKSPLSSWKHFLKSPKQDKVKPKADAKPAVFDVKKSPGKSRKWYKQPFRFGSRATDIEAKTEVTASSKDPVSVLVPPPAEVTASPRQRNRIRTNPWIPTEHLTLANTFHLSFPPIRNRSCTNTPLQQRKTPDDAPIDDQFKRIALEYESSKKYLASLERAVDLHLGERLVMELSDHSEDDVTLNEVMGTFNESYVYEKETDILSDSDPTDCEDYVSDSEAIHGGDEDSHDDELDFIDTGSLVDEQPHINRGRCSYYDSNSSKHSFLGRARPHPGPSAEVRRKSRKEKELEKRGREEKKRRSLRKLQANEDVVTVEKPIGGNLDLRKVLLQRTIDRHCSKSAENSPVSGRRMKLASQGAEAKGPDCERVMSPLVDNETDRKYDELIKEAEIMLESLRNTPVMQQKRLRHASPLPNPRSPKSRISASQNSPKFSQKAKESQPPRPSLKHLGLTLSVNDPPRKGDDKKSSYRAKASAHSPLDPLGPTFRNFSVFKAASSPKKMIPSSSSSDELEPPTRPCPLPFGFQFVDLGAATSSLCPQSEPVKRKMYSCSKTFDRLVKTFDSPAAVQVPTRVVPAFYNPMYSLSSNGYHKSKGPHQRTTLH